MKMHSLRDQDALVPQPRGTLPTWFAVGFAAFATGSGVFLFPDSFFGWAAMIVLTLTLGPLLHGIGLLAEERLHHWDTRYGGRGSLGRMWSACGLGGKTLCAAVTAGLVLHLAGDPLQNQSRCWTVLLLASGLYPLLKSLGVLGPSEVEVSDICEGRKMNVAHGLAWSFYLGYLHLVLPHLETSIAGFRATHRANGSWHRGSRKLFVLIPLSASVSHKIEDEDNNIRFYDNLPNTEIDRAGVRGRVYKHSVYIVTDECGKAHECVLEYATPLLTLSRMSRDSSAGFGESERRQQVLLFYRTLQEILDHSLDCRNNYTLILLHDEHEDEPHYLSKAILRHLQQQEREEFCLTPLSQQEVQSLPTSSRSSRANARPKAADRSCPEPMSREPTLMMSREWERPQSLKVPVENSDYQAG